ncbi:RHS repeat-associated core domain-containing protein [Labilibaculum manganireducens]|uniref:RHS repeat domain-containing protein n=1 Tax=Labilibaculum manganireducens TaxID=1940525 RepID=UPI0029F4FE6D|nr:RHS repeat-associated core domain-containing protein [Labilibaculum manganireducens]
MTVNPAAIIRYQYDNHLGSASLELDESAGIISYEEYHPFGTSSYRSGRTETETSQKRYKYVGKECDNETGLYYYGARYYASWLCRFVSVDPLQFDYPHYTPFQYAGNKPITYIDLDGLEEVKYDVNSDRYYDSRHPNSVSCLVTNQYSLTGRPINYNTYTPHEIPLGVKILALAPMAMGLVAIAAPAVAAEATLIGGTSWSSLPAVKTFMSTAGAYSLYERTIAASLDAGGQYAALRINNNSNKSLRKVNWSSVSFTFINPSSNIGVLIFNSIGANSIQVNQEEGITTGTIDEIINGVLGDVTMGFVIGKTGEGILNQSDEIGTDLTNALNKYVRQLDEGNNEAAEGTWKYIERTVVPYILFKYGAEPVTTGAAQTLKNNEINKANESSNQ